MIHQRKKKLQSWALTMPLFRILSSEYPSKQSVFEHYRHRNMEEKNRVEENTKVFIVKGGYGDVKRALKSRGWVENKDKDSPCFDLKYTLKTSDIDYNHLHTNQIVNHFGKTTSITTKVGLTHSLKNLIWFNNVDVDTFYPRCFDLGLPEETDDFISDFKATKA